MALEKHCNKSYLSECFFQGAFKITRSVYLYETGQACLYLMNPGGGYLAGDAYRIDGRRSVGNHLVLHEDLQVGKSSRRYGNEHRLASRQRSRVYT